MRYATRTNRMQSETAAAWRLHDRAHQDRQRGRDVILLSIGDPDLATPVAIGQAAIDAIHRGDTHYTEISGRDTFRDAIAADHHQRSGQHVDRANVIVLGGAQNALFATSLCLLEEGDEVIVLQPMYVTYEACIQVAGARLVPVALDAANGFRLDSSALEAAITPRTRAIFFATPNNPTGVMLRRHELEVIAALAAAHDLWVVSDEVYCDIVFAGRHQCIAGLPGMAARTVTINSLSKSHAMTGWRIGWAIAPQELIGHLYHLSLCMLYGLPGFSQEAGLHALTRARREARKMREIYRRRRNLLIDALQPIPLLSYIVPEAAMYLLIDVRPTGLSGGAFATALYDETGVATLDATTFGAAAEGYIRVSFSLSEGQLLDACERLRRFMRRFGVAAQAGGTA